MRTMFWILAAIYATTALIAVVAAVVLFRTTKVPSRLTNSVWILYFTGQIAPWTGIYVE